MNISILHQLTLICSAFDREPSLWPFVFFVPFFAALAFWQKRPHNAQTERYVRRTVIAAVSTLFGLMVLMHVFYLTEDYMSNSYAMLYADSAWYSAKGQPLYTSPESAFRYSLPYGPDGYLAVAAFQHLLGPSPFSSKLPIFCCWLGGFLFLYLALRKRNKWEIALGVITLGMAVLPQLQEFDFWPRPDLFLLFLVSMAIWIVVKDFRLSWIWLGIMIGIAVDLKVHGFIYFLPLIAVLLRRRFNLWAAAAGFVAAIIVCLLPFVLFDQISLANYLRVLRMDGGHRFSASLMKTVVSFLVVFSLIGFSPLLIYRMNNDAMGSVLKKNGFFVGGLVLGLLIVVYPASLEGAGEHHLIPFLPLFLFLGGSLYADMEASGTCVWEGSPMALSLMLSLWIYIYISASITSLTLLSHFQKDNQIAQMRDAELETIMQKYGSSVILNAPGSLRSVEGDTYRSDLVFHGMPIGVDSSAIMDFTEGHVPPASLDRLLGQVEDQYHRPVIWISPRYDEPFAETSYFHPYGRLFSDSFVQDFHRRFRLVEHSDSFDIYTEAASDHP